MALLHLGALLAKLLSKQRNYHTVVKLILRHPAVQVVLVMVLVIDPDLTVAKA
jgi:hypothetical protein